MNLFSKEGTKFVLKSALIVWRSSPKWSLINILLIFLRGMIPLVLLFLIKMLVDEVTETLKLPLEDRSYYESLIIISYAGALFLVNSFSASFSTLAREKQSHQVNDYIQGLIHHKTTKIHYSFFENPDFQDIYYRAIGDSTYRPTKIFYGLVGVIQNLITIVLLGSMLLYLDWLMSLALIAAMIPTAIHRVWQAKKMFLLQRSQTEKERQLNYYNRLLTYRDYAKELRIFNLGDLFQIRFDSLRGKLRAEQLSLLKKKTWGEMITLIFTVLVVVGFYSNIAINTLKGEISGGEMVMYFLALQRGYGYFQDLLSRLSSLYEDSLFIRNFIDFLDVKIESNDALDQVSFPKEIVSGIEFKDVSFKYEHNQKLVLDKVSLSIQPGETVALVGNNGAGKTTLVKLITGLYEPINGGVYVDGINLKSIKKSSLADNVSVIFQDFMLYNISAKENIWFGNVSNSIDLEKVESAAKNAGIDQLMKNLPNGYDTTLGNLFKDSEQLSQGEWQRVALARSFYNDAQIIILDEPTSSLDAFTEAQLIDHFKEITKGKTSIIVSHRLSTIALADKIAVLKDSKLHEFGTFDELMEKKSAFYEMVQAIKSKSY